MGSKKNNRFRNTQSGYAEGPEDDQDLRVSTAASMPPFVEVELVYEQGHIGMVTQPWQALEVWTQNRVYVTDWHMRCLEVRERPSGHSDPEHPLLGAFLAGGQRQEEGHMEMCYPCPRPGTEAVFEYRGVRKGYVNTSTVTRVVLRLRVLTVPQDRMVPTWDELVSKPEDANGPAE